MVTQQSIKNPFPGTKKQHYLTARARMPHAERSFEETSPQILPLSFLTFLPRRKRAPFVYARHIFPETKSTNMHGHIHIVPNNDTDPPTFKD